MVLSLSHQSKPKASRKQASGAADLKIRRAAKADIPAITDLILRTKRLNNEFDPLFAVVGDARSKAEKYATDAIGSKDRLLLVAADGEKVVGVLRAEMRQRLFYEPSREGFVTDFYILPAFRRKALGNEILQRASVDLKKMGAQLIVAEVPTQNEIALRFYTKRGFRSLVQHFGKKP
jgi:ribosomal protein S18 acetylase RimI-like enzyme